MISSETNEGRFAHRRRCSRPFGGCDAGLAESRGACAPDPMRPNTSPAVAFLDIGILVFREGLECILVLAAVTASMTGAKRGHRRSVALGAGLAFIASLITWLIAVRIVSSLSNNMSALDLQAATGLLAVIVLLVIMKWFFHKIYWGGWIRAHNRRRKAL